VENAQDLAVKTERQKTRAVFLFDEFELMPLEPFLAD
jgi:hypothetical protein